MYSYLDLAWSPTITATDSSEVGYTERVNGYLILLLWPGAVGPANIGDTLSREP